ncbi:MAG: c-type cytochrome, partial [Stenotrophobium sp.]
NSAEATPAAIAPRPLPTTALQAVFDRSCKACHTNPASGAPQAGDSKAWTARIAEGRDTLLDHTINGYKGMPPLGNCMDCKEDQYIALIEYMSGTTFQH